MADSPRWCDHCGRYGDHHTDKHPRLVDALELHETDCNGRSVCGCRPARRPNASKDFVVLTIDGIGRYFWSPVLEDLRFVPHGQHRQAQNWALGKENTVEGARKMAARRARELLYDRPWLK